MPQSYANMIMTFLIDELANRSPQVNEAIWFQHDGLTSHSARMAKGTV